MINAMPEYLQRIADEWRQRAGELAQWTMAHLVNRTDVWGRYLPKKHRTTTHGVKNNAITAPFRDERGKVFLGVSSLEKHFKTRNVGGVLGMHSTSADATSRWMAIDIDLHDDDDLSVTPEGNFVAARDWWSKLVELGFDALLFDSNGRGGFHLLVIFAQPMDARSVHAFAEKFVADYDRRGLDCTPDLFPGGFRRQHYGNWLRLPGRHHTHDYFTRVWNDEPWAEDRWLEGDDAIDRILRTRPAPLELLTRHGMKQFKKTVCLDFDGVVHSYLSGWCGETVIPDDPIHGVDKAIARLRDSFRVVIHSARCRSKEGRQAIEKWLEKHGIAVDEVCEHKPPAFAYVDDRAIPFTGDWDQAITDISTFRR